MLGSVPASAADNAAPDFDGNARPDDNVYTATLLAIEPKTGKLRWPRRAARCSNGDVDGIVHVCDASTGKAVWQFNTGSGIRSGLMSDAAALTDPAWIKQGRTRFVQVCAYCHGTHGTRGDAGKTAAFDARRGWGYPGHPRGDRQRACDRCQHHAGVDAIDPRRHDLEAGGLHQVAVARGRTGSAFAGARKRRRAATAQHPIKPITGNTRQHRQHPAAPLPPAVRRSAGPPAR